MNTVVTPCFNRPEFLKLWIELVLKCDQVDDLLFIFCLDYGYDRKYLDLIDDFPLMNAIIEMPLSRLKLGKQSHNVLNGLMSGANHSDCLVYYLEEDVFPSKDFFKFHAEIHKQQKDIFCSIATKNNDSPYKTNDMRSDYYLSDRYDYQALGTCFKRSVLLELIRPHFNNYYLTDPVGYCASNFPKSIIGPFFVEQDGLIRRVLEMSKGKVAFPHLPRAYHAGFYGYNRQPQILKLNYDKRLAKIRGIVFDKEQMKKWSQNEAYYADSTPVELDTDFDELRLVPALI